MGGIGAFMLPWIEFTFAPTLMSASESKTVPVDVVTEPADRTAYHWGSPMAGALHGPLPMSFVHPCIVEHSELGMTGSVQE